MVVAGIKFDKHVKVTRCIMALHHLRDILQFLDNLIKRAWVLQIQTDIGACLVADLFRISQEL